LVPRPLKEGPRPKTGKLRLNLHGICFGGKINWFKPKNSPKRRAPDFGEPRIRLGTKVRSNSRIQFASNPSKLVPRKSDPGTLSKVVLNSTALYCCTYKTTFDNILASTFGFILELTTMEMLKK